MFDGKVEAILDAGCGGIGQDAARPERPWSELHASLEPRHDLVVGEQPGNRGRDVVLRQERVRNRATIEERMNFVVAKARPEIGVAIE